MHLLPRGQRSFIASRVAPLALAILLTGLAAPAASLWNPMRSVEQCDSESKFVQAFESNTECQTHCQRTYVEQHETTREANKDLAHSYLKTGRRANEVVKCCCQFNVNWPNIVDFRGVGLSKPRETRALAGRTHCLPLGPSLRLTKRTKSAYEHLCTYLLRKKPLTMLEAVKFAEEAHYLKYMQPKHPSIRLTLKIKDLKAIEGGTAKEVRAAMEEHMMNSYKRLDQYDGYSLNSEQMKAFKYLKQQRLNAALKSRAIAMAFDEYVISYTIVDLAAASKYITELNTNQLAIPKSLLQGQFDKYDTSSKGLYFSVKGLNCMLVRDTKRKLTVYLSDVKSALSGLYEKLVYERMGERAEYLTKLQQSEHLYQQLIEVNCGSNKRAQWVH